MELSDILKINHTVEAEAVDALLAISTLQHFRKGEIIVEQDKYCKHLFLVSKGIIRFSYLLDGEDESICFGEEGCGYMSFNSYHKHEPAFFGCQAMTDVDVYCIPLSKLDELTERYVSLLRWFFKALVEELYLMEARAVNYRRQDAYTRYKTFMKNRSSIAKELPAKHIARYLDVRPETLCRLRARYIREE